MLGERLGPQLKKGVWGSCILSTVKDVIGKLSMLLHIGFLFLSFFLPNLPYAAFVKPVIHWYHIDKNHGEKTEYPRYFRISPPFGIEASHVVRKAHSYGHRVWFLPTAMEPFFPPKATSFNISGISDRPSRLLILSAITPICWYQLFVYFTCSCIQTCTGWTLLKHSMQHVSEEAKNLYERYLFVWKSSSYKGDFISSLSFSIPKLNMKFLLPLGYSCCCEASKLVCTEKEDTRQIQGIQKVFSSLTESQNNKVGKDV